MAAQSGCIVFRHRSGVHNINIYADDSAGNKIRFDDGSGAGAATSPEYRPPVPVVMDDLCLAAATGQTRTQINVNGTPIGTILLNAMHLASVVNRPRVGAVIPAGAKLELIQLA